MLWKPIHQAHPVFILVIYARQKTWIFAQQNSYIFLRLRIVHVLQSRHSSRIVDLGGLDFSCSNRRILSGLRTKSHQSRAES